MPERIDDQSQSQDNPQSPTESDGWVAVAAQYKDWHPELRVHVEVKLGQHGLGHLIESSSDSTAQEATVEPVEGAALPNETAKTTREIQEALEDANTVHIDELMSSSTFLARAKENGVDVDSLGRDNPNYWDLLAELSEGYADYRHRKGDSDLAIQGISLICKLPQFLIAQHRLGLNSDEPYDLRGRDKELASTFNASLRGFFAAYPDTSIAGLKKELAMITGYMFSDIRDRKQSIEQLNDTVRGAMHEFAFSQVLDRSGYARTGIREASAEEDLQGIDIVIDSGEWDEICLDVKASKFKIQELAQKAGIPDWKRPFFPKLGRRGFKDRKSGKIVPPRKDVIVMFSLLEDAWFGDRFALPDRYIDAVAQIIPGILEESRTVLQNMGQQRALGGRR